MEEMVGEETADTRQQLADVRMKGMNIVFAHHDVHEIVYCQRKKLVLRRLQRTILLMDCSGMACGYWCMCCW
jgi:hypothetical protein